MSKIEDKAKELGIAITEDERFIEYKKAEIAQNADVDLQKLLAEYESGRTAIVEAHQNNASEEVMKKLSAELDEKYKAITTNPNMLAFVEARKKVETLLNQVNGIIDFYVTGEEQHGCGGDCCTCGGCH